MDQPVQVGRNGFALCPRTAAGLLFLWAFSAELWMILPSLLRFSYSVSTAVTQCDPNPKKDLHRAETRGHE